MIASLQNATSMDFGFHPEIQSRCHHSLPSTQVNKHLHIFGVICMIPTIAVIGAGNMGSCLISGLINDGHPIDKIWASNPNKEKLYALKQNLQVQTTADN